MAVDREKISEDVRAVMHYAPDFVARLDLDLRYRYVNAQAGRISGIPPEAWIGRTTAELGFDPEGISPWSDAIRTARDRGEPVEVRASIELGGEPHWFETRVVPEKDEQGQVGGIVLLARDVTERQRTLDRLRDASRLLQRTFESLSEAVFVVDMPARVIVECNRAAEEMFGWRREEMIGRATSMLHTDEETSSRFGDEARRALAETGRFRSHYVMRRKDGSVFPTEHAGALLDLEERGGGLAVSVVRDRTEEVRAQRELQQSNRRLEALRDMDKAILAARSEEQVLGATVAHALDIVGCMRVCVMLLEGEEAHVAAARTREPGPSGGSEDLPPCPFPVDSLRKGRIVREDDLLKAPGPRSESLQRMAEAGVRALLTVPLGKGAELLGALSLSFAEPGSIRAEHEQVAREVADHLTLGLRQLRLEQAVREEMRERLEAERRAETLQIRLEALLDELDVGAIRLEFSGTILELNDAGKRILGIPSAEAVQGRHAREFLSTGQTWEGILQQILAEGTDQGTIETRIRRPDGTQAWVSAIGRIVRDPEKGSVFVDGVFQDDTEEMRLREEVVGISAAERLRIGQDLHDDLGQHLTGLAFSAADLARRLAAAGHVQEAAEAAEVERLANTAVRKTRHLARGVQPPVLRHPGLGGALEQLAREVDDLFGISVDLRIEDPEPEVTPAEAENLYRIAQEAVTNAARHGRATTVGIDWCQDAEGRLLVVTDDGRGFQECEREGGLGLRIMRYRTRILGGTFELEGEPGRTRLRVTLPPAEAAAAPGPGGDPGDHRREER